MKLPHTLEVIASHWKLNPTCAHAIAHEACRLQRDADFTHFDKGDKYPRLNDVSLVVPSTENKV